MRRMLKIALIGTLVLLSGIQYTRLAIGANDNQRNGSSVEALVHNIVSIALVIIYTWHQAGRSCDERDGKA